MAVFTAAPGVQLPLSGGTGNFNSDVVDRGPVERAGVVQIDATAGATPTVTVNLQGSVDNVNWFNVPYATTAAPGTTTVAAITITSTGVTQYHLLAFNWRYLRVAFTANTNVTVNTITVLV